jgi:hypothetical protein
MKFRQSKTFQSSGENGCAINTGKKDYTNANSQEPFKSAKGAFVRYRTNPAKIDIHQYLKVRASIFRSVLRKIKTGLENPTRFSMVQNK